MLSKHDCFILFPALMTNNETVSTTNALLTVAAVNLRLPVLLRRAQVTSLSLGRILWGKTQM